MPLLHIRNHEVLTALLPLVAGVMLVGMLSWNVFVTGETLFDSAGRKDVQE